jgi:LmbE family N-acetylglucosaminyl deacetylase
MSGRVAIDSAFTYAWSYQHFPEQITEEGLQPHMVEEAYMWGSESPDVFVEIGGYLEAKTLSLEAHSSQMSPVTTEERLSRISNNATRYSEQVGVEFTEAFRRIRLGLGSVEWQFLYS